jgi:RNA polymerase sigma-70 factor (family 1)
MTRPHLSDDQDLLRRLREGDEEAFNTIYNRYQALLYTYAFKLCKQEDTAKDLVQELFISLWKNRQTRDIPSSLRSYLFSAIRYKFLNIVVREQAFNRYLAEFADYIHGGNVHADDGLLLRELIVQVEKLAETLPGKMGAVFLMSRVENFSNHEIAEALHISEKTVRNLLSEASKIVRNDSGLAVLAAFFLS